MLNQELADIITSYIEDDLQRPAGVKEIADKLDRPVATVHRWLHNQDHFIQTKDKKWTTPGQSIQTWPEEGEWAQRCYDRETIVKMLVNIDENLGDLMKGEQAYLKLADMAKQRAAFIKFVVKDKLKKRYSF
jgi:hypothetical protein